MLPLFLAGGWTAAVAWLLNQPSPMSLSAPILLLGTLALIQELLSLPVGQFGSFSTAPSLYLCVCLASGSPREAQLLCIGCIALRTLLKGNFQASVRFLEALADLIPMTLALVCWQIACDPHQPWAEQPIRVALWLSLYAAASWWIPFRLACSVADVEQARWSRFRELVALPWLAVVCAGPLLALLAASNVWYPLGMLPMLWSLQYTAKSQRFRLENLEFDKLWLDYSRSRRALHKSNQQLDHTARQLELSARERQVLEQLTRTLVHSRDLQGSVRTVGEAIRSLIPTQSAVVFLSASGAVPAAQTMLGTENGPLPGLWPAWVSSPHAQRVQSGSEMLEPMVDRAFRNQTPVLRSSGDFSSWFPDEPWGLAVPLEDQGVLYLGRQNSEGLSEEEQTWLFMVASQAALGLKSARRFSSLQEALLRQEQANQALHRWVERLTILLEGARRLSESLDLTDLLDLAQGLLAPLIPHQGGWLRWQEQVRHRWPADFGKDQQIEAIVQAGTAHGRILQVDDLSQDRPPGGQPGSGSLLVAPLWTRAGVEGAILLWSDQPGAFDLEHQNLLQLVALHLSAALSSASLHAKVVEAQAQLIQSSKLAAVGQLAAGIAHELNSPLGAVVLQLDAAQLRLSTRPELVPEKLRLAQEGVGKAQAIIAKLLYYSREATVANQSVDLNQVILDTLQLTRAQIEVDGVTVLTRLEASRRVWANGNELQQVVTNLLLNARDSAIRASDKRLLAQTGSDATHVWLRVTDLGVGVPQEIQERIFEPFFTTKEVGEGTGLGLYVSLEIMRGHGGSLTLEESTGSKTTFQLKLPREANDQ